MSRYHNIYCSCCNFNADLSANEHFIVKNVGGNNHHDVDYSDKPIKINYKRAIENLLYIYPDITDKEFCNLLDIVEEIEIEKFKKKLKHYQNTRRHYLSQAKSNIF